jgi:hypothetical protein
MDVGAQATRRVRLAPSKPDRTQPFETCTDSLGWQLVTDDLLEDHMRQQAQKMKAPCPRIGLLYSDERVRDQFCANAQRLLDSVLDDPHASSTDSLIAHKALRYRNVMERLKDVDRRDPTFDISKFFGVEWQRTGKKTQ